MSAKKSNNKKSNTHVHNSVIHGQNSIYTHTVKSRDGKRQHKKSCVYYDAKTEKCMNNKCRVSICTTAHNCTVYKRKVRKQMNKPLKDGLSNYDDEYIQVPNKAGIHEPDNRFIGMSRNIGTPVHGEYLHSDGMRRHKARCIYYDKIQKICKWFMGKCRGSSHCDRYRE